MGRPVFSYELQDPDFSWLISNFQAGNPNYRYVDNNSLPVVFIGSDQPSEYEQTFLSEEGEGKDVPGPSGKS